MIYKTLCFSVVAIIIMTLGGLFISGGGSIVPPSTDTSAPEDNTPTPTPPPNIDSSTPEDGTPKPEQPQEPPEIKAQDIMLISTTNGLNIRTGAATSYPSLGHINSGDALPYIDSFDGWHSILYLGQTAYISAKYTKFLYIKKSNNPLIEKTLDIAKGLIGTPYVYGAQRLHYGNGILNPNFDGKSYDCSSLMQYIFYQSNRTLLKSTSREQAIQGGTVATLKRGDLMFFTNSSRYHLTGIDRVGHVGIYFGENYILHTASDYAIIERISDLRWSYFLWGKDFFS